MMIISDYDNSTIVIFEIYPPYTIIKTIYESNYYFYFMVLDNINNNMWVLNGFEANAYIINIETYVITTITTSSFNPGGIGFDETYIWMIYDYDTSPYVDLYTPSTYIYHSTLTNYYGFSTVTGQEYDSLSLVYQDNNMWIVSLVNNVLSIVNTTTYELIATYSGTSYNIGISGYGTSGIAYDPKNNKMWMIDYSNFENATILDNITNPVTGYSVKVNGVETDLSLIFQSISLGTKSEIPTNYNVIEYGDLNNIFAALNDETPLPYNTLYTVNVDGVQTDLSQIFLPL
jgi:hypothetical protein